MPLKVIRRKDTNTLWIDGYVNHIRRRFSAETNSLELAKERAATFEADLLRAAWHGERRGVRSFAEAVTSYLKAAHRAAGDVKRLARILSVIGELPLAEVDQTAVDRVRDTILASDPSPATVRRGVIVPIRAVLRHAHRRGWCDAPAFEIPREPQGRTRFLFPADAEAHLT